jgi:O-antigen/teichoic acid export membrane protein
MSLKKNILANYLSQFYVTLIGIAMVPLYIKYMGAEAYGLVGFFTMLQAWFNLLDMGLTPTMARETARFHGGASEALNYRRLVRALEGVFLMVALVGGTAMFAVSEYIASNWLQASQLPIVEIHRAIQLMAIITALRWMCGLYRGAISGSEKFVWLGWFNSLIATIRFIVVLPILIYFGVTTTVFFRFQLVAAVIELAGLLIYSYRLLPDMPDGQSLPWNWTPLKPVFKFSLSIAFTSSLWVLVTQTDKLVLSKMLPLKEYAYFTLAVLGASGVSLINGPIMNALLPRMAKLNAEGNETGLFCLYREATQLVCVVGIPVTLVLAFFSEQILWAWSGDTEIARKAAPVLMLYALGNGILSISSLAYCLQFAKGDLRLHLIETPLFLVIFLPWLLWSVGKYGIDGAGYSWLGTMTLFFVFWLPMIHRRFFKGQHISWLIHDVGSVLGLSLCVISIGYAVIAYSRVAEMEERLHVAVLIIILGFIAVLLSAIGSKSVRETMRNQLRFYLNKSFGSKE